MQEFSKRPKILITTGIFPPEIGGPSQYAKNLLTEFLHSGHKAVVRTYKSAEKSLPTGIRHIYFFLKILPDVCRSDYVITLDTFSVGLPTVLASRILGKTVVIRTGGDFLWEQFVERTREKILLKDFYPVSDRLLNFKEKLIFILTKLTLNLSSAVVFSTEWQKNIFTKAYELDAKKTSIIENYYGEKISKGPSIEKNFVAGTRNLVWKNQDILKNAFELARQSAPDISLDTSVTTYEDHLEKIKNSYAVALVSLGDISPNMILDAVRCGTPFVITQETGLYDRLRDIGIFVDPLNVSQIAEKLIWLSKEDNYRVMRNKIDTFSFTHSWKEIADEFLNIWHRDK